MGLDGPEVASDSFALFIADHRRTLVVSRRYDQFFWRVRAL